MQIFGNTLNRKDLMRRVGSLDQVAGVRLVELSDGAGRGVRMLEFRSGGGLEFEVIVDRAFDLGAARIDGRPLNFTAPLGVQAPWYGEARWLESWLRSFGGGLMATGGLDHTMFPTEDDASHLNYPAKPTETYPLHGRLTNIPAKLTGYGTRWDGDQPILWAEGEVRQACLFGENLSLTRRIEVVVGSNTMSLHDRVTNHAHTANPQLSLYHVNLGFPLIEEGARVIVDYEKAEPRGTFDPAGWQVFGPPQAGFSEEVMEIYPKSIDGWAEASVVNAQEDLLFHERFRSDTLPYLLLWRMFGEGTYVVGLEPSSVDTTPREALRDQGRLPMLGAGESRDYHMEFTAHSGRDAVASFLQKTEAD